MIGWLAATIDGNEERGKMVSDLQKAASHGGWLNNRLHYQISSESEVESGQG